MDFDTLAHSLAEELCEFDYTLSCSDPVWRMLFPDRQGKWNHLHINRYRGTFYIAHVNGDHDALAVEIKMPINVLGRMSGRPIPWEQANADIEGIWTPLLTSARRWLGRVKKDWVQAAKRVQSEYPLQYRYGTAPHALIRDALPGFYRLDRKLGKARSRTLIGLIERGDFSDSEKTIIPSMTANDYFDYCRIAYIAGRCNEETVDENLCGREMYIRYADGRHEGLLDIDPDSEQEFADWIDGTHPMRGTGGHPWEIKRGGNTTHIDLSVSRPSSYRKEGFRLRLQGESMGRMVETLRMLLAIQDGGHPITIANPEGVRRRLLAQDNIGIIPSYESPHRANQCFSTRQDVFDVMYYDELGRYKRRITPFITWNPLPLLKPRD